MKDVQLCLNLFNFRLVRRSKKFGINFFTCRPSISQLHPLADKFETFVFSFAPVLGTDLFLAMDQAAQQAWNIFWLSKNWKKKDDKYTKPDRHKNKSKITAQTSRRNSNILLFYSSATLPKFPLFCYFYKYTDCNQSVLQIFYLLHRWS